MAYSSCAHEIILVNVCLICKDNFRVLSFFEPLSPPNAGMNLMQLQVKRLPNEWSTRTFVHFREQLIFLFPGKRYVFSLFRITH